MELATKLPADEIVAAPWFETNLKKFIEDAGYSEEAHMEMITGVGVGKQEEKKKRNAK